MLLMADLFCIKLLQISFSAQVIKLHLHSYLVFINLKEMLSGGKKKTTKKHTK